MIQHATAIMGVIAMVASLAACGGDLSVGGKSAEDAFKNPQVVNLLRAVARDDTKEAKRLVAAGVDVNLIGEGGVTPLLWEELRRDITGMKILLDLGANPNEFAKAEIGVRSFGPPVWLAAGAGQVETLDLLLNRGGDPNQIFGNDTPLMAALNGSHLDCAELLLRHGADINTSIGPMSAFSAATSQLQYANILWVLNHGYTHDLSAAKRMIVQDKRITRSGQEALKAQALAILDQSLTTQQQANSPH